MVKSRVRGQTRVIRASTAVYAAEYGGPGKPDIVGACRMQDQRVPVVTMPYAERSAATRVVKRKQAETSGA